MTNGVVVVVIVVVVLVYVVVVIVIRFSDCAEQATFLSVTIDVGRKRRKHQR